MGMSAGAVWTSTRKPRTKEFAAERLPQFCLRERQGGQLRRRNPFALPGQRGALQSPCFHDQKRRYTVSARFRPSPSLLFDFLLAKPATKTREKNNPLLPSAKNC